MSLLDVRRPLDRGAWPETVRLRQLGAEFHRRGWSLGTSSNYSAVLGRDPLRLLLTASGKDKSRLGPNDFTIVDEQGQTVAPTEPKPSAETLLHVAAAELPGVGAVLHTHSIWATALSDRYAAHGGFVLTGYEMLKGLAGVATHETDVVVRVFENTQDIPALAAEVRRAAAEPRNPLRHGYLIRRHGMYTWGQDLEEAARQVEIFEFLFEVVGRSLLLPGFAPEGIRPLRP